MTDREFLPTFNSRSSQDIKHLIITAIFFKRFETLEMHLRLLAGSESRDNGPIILCITCKCVSIKHSVKDDFAFLWEHAIFWHPLDKSS
jgi:hypothetical protein